MKYRRICQTLNDKGKLIPSTEDPFNYVTNTDQDWYLSTYEYTSAHKETFNVSGGVAGVTDVTTDKIWWDFDNKDNLSQAQGDTIKLVSRLMECGIDHKDVVITFSGHKGFGVELNLTNTLTPEQVKTAAFKLATDLPTFDKVVYNPARILRMIGTKHQKTGMYKIPLSWSTLANSTCERILASAVNGPEDLPELRWDRVSLSEQLFVKPPETKKETAKDFKVLDIDFSKKIKGWSNCKWALTQGYEVSAGNRHEKLLCLISTSKALNYSKEQAYYNAKNSDEQGVLRNGGSKADKKDIWRMVESVYGDTWKGGTFSCRDDKTPWLTELCRSLGTHRCKKDEETIFLKSEDLFTTFYKFVQNIEKNTIKTGIKELDDNVMLTTSSLVGILGSPGSGKTTLSLDIINHCDKNNIPTIFYSMDMGVPLIYLKLAQKHWGIPHKEIFELIKTSPTKAKELKDLIDKEYGRTEMCFRTGLNVDEIRETITHYNETRPEKAKVVVIDYLECIAGPYSDATANTAIIANKLKDIALDTETCIILLLQTQKHAAAPDEPLLSMRNIKGSSVIEQACSVVLTIWREGYSPKYASQDKFISLATVKDRFNSLWKYDFKWDGLRGRITALTDEEQDQLEKLRDMKNQDKNASKEGGLNF